MRLLPLLTVAHAARTVKWEVKTTGRAPAPASFDKWFADATNPVERAIVAANDAISEVSDLGGGNYEGRISGATFPLVKLQPVMEFSLTRQNPRSISISLDKQRMETTGPAGPVASSRRWRESWTRRRRAFLRSRTTSSSARRR